MVVTEKESVLVKLNMFHSTKRNYWKTAIHKYYGSKGFSIRYVGSNKSAFNYDVLFCLNLYSYSQHYKESNFSNVGLKIETVLETWFLVNIWFEN